MLIIITEVLQDITAFSTLKGRLKCSVCMVSVARGFNFELNQVPHSSWFSEFFFLWLSETWSSDLWSFSKFSFLCLSYLVNDKLLLYSSSRVPLPPWPTPLLIITAGFFLLEFSAGLGRLSYPYLIEWPAQIPWKFVSWHSSLSPLPGRFISSFYAFPQSFPGIECFKFI